MAHNNLGTALLQAGKVEEAIGHFEQAIHLKPDPAAEHDYNLGSALLQAGRFPDAIRHFQHALRLTPDYGEAHNNLGDALLCVGKFPDAIGHYEQALRIKPDYPVAQNNLAWLLATLAPAEGGDPVRAVSLAEQACKLSGNRMAADVDTLAVAYAAAGRFHEAIATAEKAIELARAAEQPQLVKKIEARLELYRVGRAYHQPVEVTSTGNP